MPIYPGIAGSTTSPVTTPTAMDVGDSILLFNAETIALPESSVAFTPSFVKAGAAPAFTFEVLFNGAPGAFTMVIQEADTDADAYYITPTNAAYTLNAVSAFQIVRSDLIPFGGRFGRVQFTAFANFATVKATVRVTRVA